MPIKSYLVQTRSGRRPEAAAQLAALSGCTVAPAENRDVLVLVTDTPSEEADAALRLRVENVEAVSALTLVSAFAADDDLISLGVSAKP